MARKIYYSSEAPTGSLPLLLTTANLVGALDEGDASLYTSASGGNQPRNISDNAPWASGSQAMELQNLGFSQIQIYNDTNEPHIMGAGEFSFSFGFKMPSFPNSAFAIQISTKVGDPTNPEATRTITNVSATNPAQITYTGVDFDDGQRVEITGTGISTLDNKKPVVTVISPGVISVPLDGGVGGVVGSVDVPWDTDEAISLIFTTTGGLDDPAIRIQYGAEDIDGNLVTTLSDKAVIATAIPDNTWRMLRVQGSITNSIPGGKSLRLSYDDDIEIVSSTDPIDLIAAKTWHSIQYGNDRSSASAAIYDELKTYDDINFNGETFPSGDVEVSPFVSLTAMGEVTIASAANVGWVSEIISDSNGVPLTTESCDWYVRDTLTGASKINGTSNLVGGVLTIDNDGIGNVGEIVQITVVVGIESLVVEDQTIVDLDA